MSDLKKIFVFTASGDQGGSVARYLAKTGEYEVIGMTRNPESQKAKELAKLGVKVVKGDLDDLSSYEPHLQGIYGAYVNADFWTKFFANGFDGPAAGQYEYEIATGAIEAVAKAGAKHIVYSTLDEVPYTPHFHYKQEVTKWADKQGYPMTNLYVGHYMSNLIKYDLLKANDEGGLTLSLPASDSTPIYNYASEQTGGWVTAIFKDFEKYIGTRVDAVSQITTLGEWAKIISEIVGKPVKTMGLPDEIFQNYDSLVQAGVPEELIVNYKGAFEKYATWDLKKSLEVYPEAWDIVAWAKNTGTLDQFKA